MANSTVHRMLWTSTTGGIGDFLAGLLKTVLPLRQDRVNWELAILAAHCSSQTITTKLLQQAAKSGCICETDKMVILVRGEGETYSCEAGLAPLLKLLTGLRRFRKIGFQKIGSV